MGPADSRSHCVETGIGFEAFSAGFSCPNAVAQHIVIRNVIPENPFKSRWQLMNFDLLYLERRVEEFLHRESHWVVKGWATGEWTTIQICYRMLSPLATLKE